MTEFESRILAMTTAATATLSWFGKKVGTGTLLLSYRDAISAASREDLSLRRGRYLKADHSSWGGNIVSTPLNVLRLTNSPQTIVKANNKNYE